MVRKKVSLHGEKPSGPQRGPRGSVREATRSEYTGCTLYSDLVSKKNCFSKDKLEALMSAMGVAK